MRITPRRARWLSLLGATVLRVLGSTWRVRRLGHVPPDWRVLGAFLHGDILMMAHVFKGYGAAVLISQHGDGELIARTAQRLGNHPVRGSSTRGGARAFLEMVKQCPDRPWGITPDGPRGPRGHVHEGVIQLAAEGGRPLYPIGFAFSRGRRLRSWDRFAVPAPFARVAVYFGPPIQVPNELSRAHRAALADELAQRLRDAEAAAAAGLRTGAPSAAWPERPRGSSAFAARRAADKRAP